MRSIYCAMALALTLGLGGAAPATDLPVCGNVGDDVRAADHEVVDCLANGAECDAVDHLKRFYNMERILPTPRPGQGYREARVGHGPHGSAGARRLVVLLDGPEGRGRVLGQYYTVDHYLHFCEITPDDGKRRGWFHR